MKDLLFVLFLFVVIFGFMFGVALGMFETEKSICQSKIILYANIGLPNKIVWREGKNILDNYGCYVKVKAGDKNIMIPLNDFENALGK